MKAGLTKKLLLSAAVLAALAVGISACGSDDDDKETGTPAAKLSFTNDIKPIVDAHCISCHSVAAAPSAGDGVVMDTEAKFLATEGEKKTVAAGRMPLPNPSSLPAADKAKIIQFLAQ